MDKIVRRTGSDREVMLIAKCLQCSHEMPVASGIPLNLTCPRCGYSQFQFNQDIELKNEVCTISLPKGTSFISRHTLASGINSYIWQIVKGQEIQEPGEKTDNSSEPIQESQNQIIVDEEPKEEPVPLPLENKPKPTPRPKPASTKKRDKKTEIRRRKKSVKL